MVLTKSAHDLGPAFAAGAEVAGCSEGTGISSLA